MTDVPKDIRAPIEAQQFTSFQEWVNKATSWLTRHPEYRNTEHGETKGWRGYHFTAMCFDSKGRRCRNGADFMRARDEDAFPVWWVWPDQIAALLSERERRTPDVVTWQPIETAPRDGTVILAAHNQAAFTVWWDEDSGGWVDGVTDRYEDLVVYPVVTHWQHLPDLPAAPSLPSDAGRSEG